MSKHVLLLIAVVLSCSCAHRAEPPTLRDHAALGLRIGGGVLAAGGPAVVIAGIALDPKPTTPPVESFLLGAALSTAGVAAVIAGGVLADSEAPAG